MKTLSTKELEMIKGGMDCATQTGLGFGLMVGGLLLGTVTFGLGAAVVIVGYGIGWDGARGRGCEQY